ncbi:unnamed protein product [Symbiodinium sp. CCMP2592]|nr:unnamed protein product [Symbiodinium sp. CCMP2592]
MDVMPGNRGSGYQPADAAGHFVSQPQAPTGAQDVFDFEELETDPSERRPGGSLAKRLWSASPEVRQWKWVSVGLVFLAAFFLQSLSLYFATRRYVRWVGGLTDKAKEHHASHFGDRSQHPQLDMLVLRLLQPRDTVGEMLNVGDGVSKMPFDILLSVLPLFWLAAVVQARNLRLWTRTLLAAAFLALLRGLLSSLTLLPNPLGWQGCEANLRPEVMAHYQGQQGFADVAKGTGLVLWLWLQDLALGMRLQEHLVCAGGASLSGSAFFSALFALAIYDLSRMWTRKMKPHFRSLAHLASGGLLTVLVLVDVSIDVALGRQYTAGVTMSLVLALLTYQSPALAVCADRLLVRGTPALNTLAGQAPPKETHQTEDTSRDLGDIVVPPCCLPFCGFHGRYFLYSQPASEKEQELLAQRQAQAELEQLQKEQESTTRRLLELEAQLESLHARQAERAAEEPKIFEEQLQATSLVNIWFGRNEEGQEEQLELRPNGGFVHSLVHEDQQSGDQVSVKECRGEWKVHRVKHLGADLNAEGDREIELKVPSSDAEPAIVDRLVVCGTAPGVNGFQGAACRLYPENYHTPSKPRAAPPAPSAEELQVLSETTGFSTERCAASLRAVIGANSQSDESSRAALLEAAASRLFEESPPNDTAAAATPEVSEESIQQLVACTGRSENDCRSALQQYGNVDAAAEILLDGEVQLGSSAASSSSAPPAPAEAASAPGPSDAQRLVELTGLSLEKCQEALTKVSSLDAAAALLLDGELPAEASQESRAAEPAEDAAEDGGMYLADEDEESDGCADDDAPEDDGADAAVEEPEAKRPRTGDSDKEL